MVLSSSVEQKRTGSELRSLCATGLAEVFLRKKKNLSVAHRDLSLKNCDPDDWEPSQTSFLFCLRQKGSMFFLCQHHGEKSI